MIHKDLSYYFTILRIKLSPGIGDVYGRMIYSEIKNHPQLLDYSLSELKRYFPSWDKKLFKEIIHAQKTDLKERIFREWEIIQKNDIRILEYNDSMYPDLLKQIPDAPYFLFCKGICDLNHSRNISVVGTRKNSEWSKSFTEEIICDLKSYQPHIISGLALGIDSIAHKSALQNDIPTTAVLANGILNIYPTQNIRLAQDILENGGALISEHFPMTFADRQNFPLRNRIVAGISPLTLLIESPIKGGSMITGKLAAAYNRDVAAVPGRPKDEKSHGCHYLIKSNIAHLVNTADDIANIMDWEVKKKKPLPVQLKIDNDLNMEEREIISLMEQSDSHFWHIDELIIRLNKSNTVIASLLLCLEIQGLIQALPGKRYRLI